MADVLSWKIAKIHLAFWKTAGVIHEFPGKGNPYWAASTYSHVQQSPSHSYNLHMWMGSCGNRFTISQRDLSFNIALIGNRQLDFLHLCILMLYSCISNIINYLDPKGITSEIFKLLACKKTKKLKTKKYMDYIFHLKNQYFSRDNRLYFTNSL